MQKVPALLKVRQEQNQINSFRVGEQRENSGICALLRAKSNSDLLYTNVVDNEYGGQEKYTFNTFNNTR